MIKKTYISPLAAVEEHFPDYMLCSSPISGLGNEDLVDSGYSIEWE